MDTSYEDLKTAFNRLNGRRLLEAARTGQPTENRRAGINNHHDLSVIIQACGMSALHEMTLQEMEIASSLCRSLSRYSAQEVIRRGSVIRAARQVSHISPKTLRELWSQGSQRSASAVEAMGILLEKTMKYDTDASAMVSRDPLAASELHACAPAGYWTKIHHLVNEGFSLHKARRAVESEIGITLSEYRHEAGLA